MHPKSILCTHCFTEHEPGAQKRKMVWPGMPCYRCRSCGERFLYPMTPANRVVAWLLLGGMGAAALLTVRDGGVPIPGLGALLFVWGLCRDHGARQALLRARSLRAQRDAARVAEGSRPPPLPLAAEAPHADTRPLEERLGSLGFRT
jgi:hypothetical protein